MKEVLKEKLRRSLWLEIDLDQLESNYLALKEMVGSVKVMPAVKANGYGHGIVQCSQVLAECGADYLGVGSADEAILLRENGVRTPILVFESSFIPDMAGVFKEYDLMPTVFNMEQAQALSAVTDKEMKIFVKIDTGRGRLGINAEEFPHYYKKLKELQNLKVDGVYSHMCGAEWPDENCPSRSEYPLWQYRRFCKAMEGIGEERKNIPFRQLANTPACIAYPEREDSYLTCDSVQFHAHLGYRMVGQFHQCGYKFGTWYHMVWMEKIIGAHTAYPNPIIRFSELDRNTLYALGIQEYLHV